MKKIAVFPVILLVLAFSAAAQDNGNSYVVTQITAEARNNLIRITWADSPDARGPVYIFRSTRPFSGSIPANIRPVIVKYGEQYYIDDSDDMENLYYFIAASDVSGKRYDIIIPRVNSAVVNVSGTAAEIPAEIMALTDQKTEQKPEPVQGIYNLAATPDGERIMITFDVNGARKNAVLYRSTQPIKAPRDLLNAVMIQSGSRSPFVDFPVPGLSCYYALIFEDEISGGNMGINPGVNATMSAVTVYSGGVSERALRPMPLPAMTLNNALPDGYFMPDNAGKTDSTSLNGSAAKKIANTSVPDKVPLEKRKPRIFTIDLQAPSGGEDSALFEIISETFAKRDWEKARAGLQNYLALPRSNDIEARARFYLGQTLYFTGNYRGALFEFLAIKSIHPVEANMWIESTLAAMVY